MTDGTPSDHGGSAEAKTVRRSADETPTVAGENHPRQTALQFVPGVVLANRYRVVSTLGKGGMGEVYRADDLKLGQPVALKFLAPGAASPARQRQLIDEVRLGREVSHPNVCRLYDVGEVDGHLFISMELIDGEDMASLLRRIGRLPGDKALELAREICAGLGAAHDCGIVHRDLKPGNIMIDGRGRARITDFGLARPAGHREADGLVSGTPTYMAPEQFEGAPATVASDLYALGLILYEIWTGRRFVSGTSLKEIIEEHRSGSREVLRAAEIDRPIASVIEKCIARDPAARPPSARAVLALLPGGDALDAALAAGETPSPAMVAAASEKGELSRTAAWSCLVAVILGVVGIAALTPRTTIRGRVSLPHATPRLEQRAQDAISAIGWNESAVPRSDQASWFEYDRDFIRWREQQKGNTPASLNHAMLFKYRQSPRLMVTTVESSNRVSDSDPPFNEPGMVHLALTSDGYLRSFAIVPPRNEGSGGDEADWSRVFQVAGIDPRTLMQSAPEKITPVDNDRKRAWTGRDPADGVPIRVEGASLRGRPVWFRVFYPWTNAVRKGASALADAIVSAIETALFIAVPISALLLARRNLRRGQGDRKGATRLSLFILFLSSVLGMLRAHHVPDVQEEGALTVFVLAYGLFIAVAVWFIYVAMEPFARRRWPKTLISWNRLLQGRFLDPMIGRDVLVGLVGGLVVTVITMLTSIVPEWIGLGSPIPLIVPLMSLSSSYLDVAYALLAIPTITVLRAIGAIAVFVFVRGVVRNQKVTVLIGLVLVGGAVLDLVTGPIGVRVAAIVLTAPIALILLFRFGLLAMCAETALLETARRLPLTLDPSSWYFGRSLLVLVLVVAVALFAFWRSLGSKPILPGPVFEE